MGDEEFRRLSLEWLGVSAARKYSYNFEWLGRPIIQYPQDIIALQEIIWRVQPDLIIETGVAHGGSLIFYATMLELNAICGGAVDAEVVGIDIEIRSANRLAIERHPMTRRIRLIEGSSTSQSTINSVKSMAEGKKRIMVALDSNHTHAHVLAELNAYASLVTVDSYCVVFDTAIEDVPSEMFFDRPWGRGNNPKTAVYEFLKEHSEFIVDDDIANKLMITVSPGGYLRRDR